jgi:cyclohexadieny/prephenate dehydrogenase
MSDVFNHVAIIGGGLIGSSLARATRKALPQCRISIADADEQVLARLGALNIADMLCADVADAAREADLVILCVPVRACADVMTNIAPALKKGALLSDVGSVKAHVIEAITPLLPDGVHFVPAHPVAGTENSGPDAGFATLFQNRWCIITPLHGSDEAAVQRLDDYWKSLGALTERMDPQHHDLVLAVTSHVPHLIAYTIVGTASDLEGVTQSEVIKYSAGGFRDFTRIAASNPTMWRDVFLTNKTAVLEILQRLSEDLTMLQRAIRWDQGDVLHDLFTRTRAIRRSIIDAGQDTAEDDFGRKHD